MKYYIIAGEASGDLHASNLMQSLKELDPQADFRYFGGDLMAAQGGTLVKHYRELAYMGIIPVMLNLGTILSNLSLCKKDIEQYRPDVVILVDYPGFNLKIAKFVKEKLGIPIHYYISPKVWAWKEYRVKSFKKYVDEMYCILPFETDFYKKHNYPVHYVGNPTVDAIANRKYKDETFDDFIKVNNLPHKPIIALLAGSRKQEISGNLPVMLKSLKGYAEDYQFVIAGAPGISPEFYEPFIKDFPVTLFFNQTYRILAHSEAAMVASGTATLEAALLNVPQVVCYQTPMPTLSHWAFEHILHTPYISLVNLICNHEVVKEYFAKTFTVDNVRRELTQLLHVQNYRKTMQGNYAEMREILGSSGASNRVAELIYKKTVK